MCHICSKQDEIWLRHFSIEDLEAWRDRQTKMLLFNDPSLMIGPANTRFLSYPHSPVNHEEAMRIIESLRGFYERITPDEFEILNMSCEDPRQPKAPTPKPKPAKIPGFVYVIKNDAGLYKIGKTINPKDRIKIFSVKLPFDIEYTMVIRTKDYSSLETKLHKRFAHKRKRGEWFTLSEDDIERLRAEYAKHIVDPDKVRTRK